MAVKRAQAPAGVGGWRTTITPGDIYEWSVKLPLPLFPRPFIHARFEEEDRRRRPRQARRRFLDELGGYGDGPDAAVAKAIDFLAANEAAVYAKALAAIAAYEASFTERPAARRLNAAQTAQRISFTHASVSRKPRRDIAYLVLAGECAWDREHGSDVVLDRLRVVDVCQQGTGWIDRGRKTK